MDIYVGMEFDTEFESNCVVTSLANFHEFGTFLAKDSDGVECEFHVSMILPNRPSH